MNEVRDLVQKVRDDPTDTMNVLQLCDAVDRYDCDLTTDEVLDTYLNSCICDSSEDSRRTSTNGLNALGIPLVYKGIAFKSMMHAFQAQKLKYTNKFVGKEDQLAEAMTKFADVDLDVVNQRGRALRGVDIVKWDADKLSIMDEIMAQLISSNKMVYEKLLAAPDDLIEDLIQAPYWGLPENNMGKLWTQYRNKITSGTTDTDIMRLHGSSSSVEEFITDDIMRALDGGAGDENKGKRKRL